MVIPTRRMKNVPTGALTVTYRRLLSAESTVGVTVIPVTVAS